MVKLIGKSLLYIALGLLAFVFVAQLLNLWVGQNPARAESVRLAADSRWLFLVRYSLFALIWFGWERLLRWCSPRIDASLIRQGRRPLALLIISYELLFAQNLIGRLA